MFDGAKFLGAILTGAATATAVNLAGQMTPGGYGMKLGAQVATTAVVTGALHLGGAPDHIRDAAAVGGGAVVAARVADEVALYQAIAKARGASDVPRQGGQQGNNTTSGLGDGRRAASWRENARVAA